MKREQQAVPASAPDDGRESEVATFGLLQSYRSLADERTPESLDRAVLAAAATALRHSSARRIRPWMVLAASLSVVSLSALLVWQSPKQAQEGVQAVVAKAGEPANDMSDRARATAAKPSVAPGSLVSDAALPSPLPPALGRESESASAEPLVAQSPMLGAAGAEAVASEPEDDRIDLNVATSERGRATSETAATVAHAGATAGGMANSDLRDHPDVPSAHRQSPSAATMPSRSAAPSRYAVPAPQPASPNTQTGNPLSSDQTVEKRKLAEATASVPMAHTESDSVGKPNPLSAESWLDQIRKLVADRHVAEARVALKAWRERYPREKVPEDLRFLLEPRQ